MVASQKGMPVKDVQVLFSSGAIGGLSDAQLLDRFVSKHEEVIFEAILQRHGPMVWGVCRRVLRDDHDVEDAFQATLLVFVRKAASVMPREKLGNWLYGVAYQTAMKARATTSKRRAREKQVPDLPEPVEAVHMDHWDDLLPLLDQELHRLPERYRIPIVLCDLGGKTHKQAAEELGWPVGTVSGRLSRARSVLAKQLTRRGVTLAGSLPAVLLAQGSASASAPLPLVTSTTRAATKIAAGQAAAEVVSARVAALTEGVLKAMLMTKFKIAITILMVMALGTAGTRLFDLGRRAVAGQETAVVTKPTSGEIAQVKREVAAALLPDPDQPSAPLPVTYKVQWRVSGIGQEDSLGPSVTTLGGQPARIHLGTKAHAPNGEVMPLGLIFTATTTPMQDGRVCVSVRADRTERDQTEGEGLQIQGESLQIVRVVKLGEAIDLEFRPAKGDLKGKPTRLSLNVVSQMK